MFRLNYSIAEQGLDYVMDEAGKGILVGYDKDQLIFLSLRDQSGR